MNKCFWPRLVSPFACSVWAVGVGIQRLTFRHLSIRRSIGEPCKGGIVWPVVVATATFSPKGKRVEKKMAACWVMLSSLQMVPQGPLGDCGRVAVWGCFALSLAAASPANSTLLPTRLQAGWTFAVLPAEAQTEAQAWGRHTWTPEGCLSLGCPLVLLLPTAACAISSALMLPSCLPPQTPTPHQHLLPDKGIRVGLWVPPKNEREKSGVGGWGGTRPVCACLHGCWTDN